MYRSLLVPLDGSAFAEQALPLALSIADRAGATLNLVRVHVPLAFMSADSVPPFDLAQDKKIVELEQQYLDATGERLKSSSPVLVTSKLLEGMAVAETLTGHAATTGADLIIMATHGRGRLSRFWLGSVADELVRRATKPILLVRPQETPVDLAAKPVLRHILIPLDGSVLAEQVLEPAMVLGRLMEADYTLLRIYGYLVDTGLDPVNYAMFGIAGPQPSIEQLRAETHNYLNLVAERLKEQGVSVQTESARGQHPASAILDATRSLGVDLIALETHGRGGLTRLLLGNVADKVIRGASAPVFVHRAPGD
jgi:nucleotide-binding universal stress UspA family protein